MNAVENNETYRCEFIVEGSNENIVKEVMQKDYL